MRLDHFISELQRRRVLRAGCAYGVAAIATVEAANNFFPPLHLPDWTTTLVALLAIVGFPITLVLAWAFDVKPANEEVATHVPLHVSRPLRSGAYLGAGMLIVLVGFGGYSAYRAFPTRGVDASVAVLPFTNLSAEPENEYFADGMTEDVLGQLGKVRQIRLIPRTSVMQYKRTRKPVKEIAKELGVTHVLEGSIRRYGDQIRISAKLIRADVDELIWTESYDRAVTDVLALQSEIAREIARKLNVRLGGTVRQHFADGLKESIDPAAYEAYLRGIYEGDRGQQAAAIRNFELAVQIEPDFARAYVGIARNAFFLGFYGLVAPDQAFGKMRMAAQRALDLDESLADAHAALALYYGHYQRDWQLAEDGFQRALELNPNNAQVHHDYAHLLLALGRRDDSAAESMKAAQLDPSNSMLVACAGWHGFANGAYDDAIARSLKALMMMPNMFWPEMVLGWAYEQTGRATEAIASFKQASGSSNGSVFSMASLGHALARAKRVNEARALLADLEARRAESYVSAYEIAVVYAALDDRDSALKWLEQARAERSGFLVHAGWDARFAPLHADPRFDAFLKSIGLPKQALAAPRPGAQAPMPQVSM